MAVQPVCSCQAQAKNCSLTEQLDNVQGGKMAAQYDQTAKERNLDFEKVKSRALPVASACGTV